MQRRNFWFIIAGLTSVWLFASSTRADVRGNMFFGTGFSGTATRLG